MPRMAKRVNCLPRFVTPVSYTHLDVYKRQDYCYPCGMCRQFMKEFAPDMQVICLNGKGDALELTLRDLLPYGFDSTFLPR